MGNEKAADKLIVLFSHGYERRTMSWFYKGERIGGLDKAVHHMATLSAIRLLLKDGYYIEKNGTAVGHPDFSHGLSVRVLPGS